MFIDFDLVINLNSKRTAFVVSMLYEPMCFGHLLMTPPVSAQKLSCISFPAGSSF
jgi:hypothetical protein